MRKNFVHTALGSAFDPITLHFDQITLPWTPALDLLHHTIRARLTCEGAAALQHRACERLRPHAPAQRGRRRLERHPGSMWRALRSVLAMARRAWGTQVERALRAHLEDKLAAAGRAAEGAAPRADAAAATGAADEARCAASDAEGTRKAAQEAHARAAAEARRPDTLRAQQTEAGRMSLMRLGSAPISAQATFPLPVPATSTAHHCCCRALREERRRSGCGRRWGAAGGASQGSQGARACMDRRACAWSRTPQGSGWPARLSRAGARCGHAPLSALA